VALSGHLETLSNWFWGQAWLQRKMSFWDLRSGVRWRCPRLARRHPDGESEGIWDGPISIVRPELRRGYDGRPCDIGSSGESGGGTPGRHVFVTGGPQSWGTRSPVTRVSWDLALGFRGNERVRSWLCVLGGLSKRGPWWLIGRCWMVIGGALWRSKFPVSSECGF
jgi:hypothetical protein